MDLCTNISVLKILKIIISCLNLIKNLIIFILIILIMVNFYKALTSDKEDALSNAITNSIKKIIAALAIFIVPVIVNAIFNLVNTNNTILACITNANDKKINEININQIENLIAQAKSTLSEDDYIAVKERILKLKDENEKNKYLQEIASLGDSISINKIELLIKKAKETLDSSDYNTALSYINNVNDSTKKIAYQTELNKISELVKLKSDILKLGQDISNYDNVYNRIMNLSDDNVKNNFLELISNYKAPAKLLNIESGAFEKNMNGLDYYEVIPDKAEENMPLIIFLHGYNENMGMTTLKNISISKYVASKEAFNVGKFIYIAPLTKDGWNVNGIKQLIDSKVNEYKIDSNRIVIIGHSMGGGAVWNIVNKNPNYFAGAMPISYPPDDYNPLPENFKTTSIYALCGESEELYYQKMNDFVSKIKSIGGNAKMESVAGKNHGSVTDVFNGPELYKWMLSQKR